MCNNFRGYKMLSNKEIQKCIKEAEETFKYLVDTTPEIVKQTDFDFFLLYLYSYELIKHSKRLWFWTVAIAILTLILIVITSLDVWRFLAN